MKSQILILGTYHFGSQGEHLINHEKQDILSEKKQQEVTGVIDKLIRFKPNKIAVELNKNEEEKLNEIYKYYLSKDKLIDNNLINERSEVFQVAFKMAKLLKHQAIYPLNYPVDLPDEFLEYSKENDKVSYENIVGGLNELVKNEGKVIKEDSILNIFRMLNDVNRIENQHSKFYLEAVKIGAGYNYCGAKFITEWYRRNLYIFGNLQNIAKENDRLLVIYGADHCKILRNLINDYEEFQLVDATTYLS